MNDDEETYNDLFYAKEMNLYNNLQKKLEKQREKQLLEEQQKHLIPWQVSKNSRKIIVNKLREEKPIYERSSEIAEKKKRELENASRRSEIEKENEMRKMKTRWNIEKKIDKESFENFIEKQKLWELNKQSKVTILREEYDEIMKKAIKETMFKPDIRKKPQSAAKKNNHDSKRVHERLYECNEELKNKKAILEKRNQPKFVPTINKKLPKYIKNKNKHLNENIYNLEEDKHGLDYSNFSNELGFENETKVQYANNLMNFTNVENLNPIYNNFEKKTLNKKEEKIENSENILLNRKFSAQKEKKDSHVILNKILKNKLEKKDFELEKQGFKSDLNNINAGNNLKNLLNGHKDDNINVYKPKKSLEIVYRNLSNGKINKKLSEKLPLERFSVPVNNIRINYQFTPNDSEDIKDQVRNQEIKRLNTMVPEYKSKIEGSENLKINKKSTVYNPNSINIPIIDNLDPNIKENQDNLSQTNFLDESSQININHSRKESSNTNRNYKYNKRLSNSIVEENRSKNFISKSLNKEENIENEQISNNAHIMYSNVKRNSLIQNEAFVYSKFKEASNIYDFVGNFKNRK